MIRRLKRGFERRLRVTRFLKVGDAHLSHVWLLQKEDGYDGDLQSEGVWWSAEISEGEHVLCERLPQALSFFPPEDLKTAVTGDPTAFAEVVAVENGFGRVAVAGPGRFVAQIFERHGIEVEPVKFEGGILSFQIYMRGRVGSRQTGPQRIYSVRASLDAKIISKRLFASF
jgi:hypothetical protein